MAFRRLHVIELRDECHGMAAIKTQTTAVILRGNHLIQ